MNVALLIAGLVAAFMVVGHSTIGARQFYTPMLAADFDPVSKRIMGFVWHMSTATLVVATVALIYAAFATGLSALAIYAGAQFLIYGAIHLFLTATSEQPGAVIKQFQWSLFLTVGIAALIGSTL